MDHNGNEEENSGLDESTEFNQQFQNDSFQDSDNFLKYEKLNCFYLLKKYIKEIFVRMKQFKDELLASCLEFLLSLPKELVIYNLEECFSALEVC
jgi:hypothetical protein